MNVSFLYNRHGFRCMYDIKYFRVVSRSESMRIHYNPPPPNQQDPTLNDRILISYGRLELLFELHFLVFIRHYCSCHFRDQVFFMTH